MKKIFTLLLLTLSLIAQATKIDWTKVNPNWQYQVLHVTPILPEGNTHTQLIKAHLLTVIKELKQRPTSFTTKQNKERHNLLNILQAYAMEQKFPKNEMVAGIQPVFIDNYGTHCAVGYMMQQSGYQALATRINKEHQLSYIKNITTPGISAWATEHGFTIDELAWIQPGYIGNEAKYKFTDGVNGTIYSLLEITPDMVLIGGSFNTLANGTVSNNLAWANKVGGSWVINPILGGTNGPVHALCKQNNLIYIGGNFSLANGVVCNNMVAYNLLSSANPFEVMPGFDSTVLTLAIFKDTLYAGGKFSNLLSKLGTTSWININNLITGNEVKALHVFNNILYIGGNFELLTGAPRFNVCKYNNMYLSNTGFGCSNPITDFETFKGNLYASCLYKSKDSTHVAVAQFKDSADEWATVLFADTVYTLSGKGIYDLCAIGDTMYAMGEFFNSEGGLVGNYNYNLSKITELNGNLKQYVAPNINGATFKGIAINNKLVFGGSFSGMPDSCKSIATLDGTLPNFITSLKATQWVVYPNPTTNELFIKSDKIISTINIYNNNGQIIKTVKGLNNTFKLQPLAAGIYTIGNENGFGKIIVE
jgi:hypothetical protein